MSHFYRILARAPRRLPPYILSSLYISSFSTYSTTPTKSFSRSRRKTPPPPPPLPPPPELDLNGFSTDEEIQKVEMVFNRPKPGEIPFQPKVANSVNLIGTVQSPVKFQTRPDGKCWAATYISLDHYSNPQTLRIPVIFEGDLAHTAACHVKEKDNIYVAGELRSDPNPLKLLEAQASLQVAVRSINFVQGFPGSKESPMLEQEVETIKSSDDVMSSSTDNGIEERSQLQSDSRVGKTFSKKMTSNVASNALDSWKELVDNPGEWNDHRVDKTMQKLNPKYPDFKHKVDGRALWLDSRTTPKWVLQKLEELESDTKVYKTVKVGEQKASAKPGYEFWKDLAENPNKWWDNRSTKRSPKHPDFKRKDTGEGLWLDKAPDWVKSKLPLLKSADSTFGKETLLS